MRWSVAIAAFLLGVALTLLLAPSNHVVTTTRSDDRTGQVVERDSVIGCSSPVLSHDNQLVETADNFDPPQSTSVVIECGDVAGERFRGAAAAGIGAVIVLIAGQVLRRRTVVPPPTPTNEPQDHLTQRI